MRKLIIIIFILATITWSTPIVELPAHIIEIRLMHDVEIWFEAWTGKKMYEAGTGREWEEK